MIDLLEFDFTRSKKAGNFIKQAASEYDFKHFITESSFVNLEDNKPIVYLKDQLLDLDILWQYLNKPIFTKTTRHGQASDGETALFHATSPTINRTGFCGFGALAIKDKALDNLLVEYFSRQMTQQLAMYLPGWKQVNDKLRSLSLIHDDYFMADTFWTSGILNKNNQSPYHYDKLNQPHMMSGMFSLKRKMSGGYLVFPEYELAFEVADKSVIFFCGRDILHGVSPMKIHPGGVRYTGVYYTTASLKKCGSYLSEIEKGLR